MQNLAPSLHRFLVVASLLLAMTLYGCASANDVADGTFQLQNNEYDAAIDSFTQALSHKRLLNSVQADALMLRGEAYLKKGDADKALADLNASLGIEPDDMKARTLRGSAWLEKGNLEAAAADFSAVLESFNKRARGSAISRSDMSMPAEYIRLAARSHLGLGVIDLYQERYQEALDHFDTAVNMAPYEPEFYLMRGGALRLMEQEDFAEKDLAMFEDLSQNATISPESRLAPLKLKKSIQLFEAGEFQASERLAKEALKINPNYTAAYRRLGLARLQQGKLKLAEADFDKAIASDPGNLEAWLYRSYTRMERRKFEDSLADIEHVLEIRPDWLEARLYRGMVLSESGQYQESVEDFEFVLAERPEDVTALEGLAFSLFSLEQFDNAMEQLQQLKTVSADSPKAYRLEGLIYMKREDFPKALEALNNAEDRGDRSMQLYLAKGSILRAMGDVEMAEAMFEKALDASQAEEAALPTLD